MIMTGLSTSADALTSRTAQLPKIAFETPHNLIGKNTVDSMRNGIMYANACAIDGITERMEEELCEKCTVIATGGLAGVIVPLCRKNVILDDELLLLKKTILFPSYHICIYILPYFLIILFATDNVVIE